MIRTPQQIVKRASGSRDSNGRWVDGTAASTSTVLASVQPASAGDYDTLQALDLGRRIERSVRIYTAARLNVAGEDGHNGDILVWQGVRYVVMAVSPWRTTALRHYRYLASKELEA